MAQVHIEPPPAKIALFLVKLEMDKARLQFQRLRHDSQDLDSLLHGTSERAELWMSEDYQRRRMESMVALFADIHFLLICLDKLDLLVKMLARLLPMAEEIAGVRKKYAVILREYSTFRNHLEHIDERVERGISDLGNLNNGSFTFDGRLFDVGPSREREVEEIFEAILHALETISNRNIPRCPVGP